MKSPTAQTSLAEMLATPLRSLTEGPGLGLGTTLQTACACATAGASRASSTTPTMHKKRLTFKRFMILLSISALLEQVTVRQADQGHHQDAMASCQQDDHPLATIRCRAFSKQVAEGAWTLMRAELLWCPSMQEASAPVLCRALAGSRLTASRPDQHRPRILKQLRIEL